MRLSLYWTAVHWTLVQLTQPRAILLGMSRRSRPPPASLLLRGLGILGRLRRMSEGQAVTAVQVGEILGDLVAHDDFLNRKIPAEIGLTARLNVESDRPTPSEAVRGVIREHLDHPDGLECLRNDRILAFRAVGHGDFLLRLIRGAQVRLERRLPRPGRVAVVARAGLLT